jgi:hypothetical protein
MITTLQNLRDGAPFSCDGRPGRLIRLSEAAARVVWVDEWIQEDFPTAKGERVCFAKPPKPIAIAPGAVVEADPVDLLWRI